jgi:anthranilate 1,2-dioxygenase large subunit
MALNRAQAAEKLVYFPRADGSRIPYKVYSSPEIYQLEQQRIFRGPTWSFVAFEAEIPRANDFKNTFVGETPVAVTRAEEGTLAAWVNRCAHRGATVCLAARGHAKTHVCIYHQWSYDNRGNLRGLPFPNGFKGAAGMPADFEVSEHGLEKLRVEAIGDSSSRPSVSKRRRSVITSALRCVRGSTASFTKSFTLAAHAST